MKKSHIIIICAGITIITAHYSFIQQKKNAETLVEADVEAITSCEATYPNKQGVLVTIKCVGEKGTCHIKKEDKVSTPYGNFTVYVDATCSGVEVAQ